MSVAPYFLPHSLRCGDASLSHETAHRVEVHPDISFNSKRNFGSISLNYVTASALLIPDCDNRPEEARKAASLENSRRHPPAGVFRALFGCVSTGER